MEIIAICKANLNYFQSYGILTRNKKTKMSQLNRLHNDKPSEGGTILPGGFIGLYAELTKKGWSQSADVSGEPGKARKRAGTVEVQHMVLEKQCVNESANVKKIQIIMKLQDGKVKCQMFTDPFISYFFRTSIKDMNHLEFLLREIDDYYDLFNASPEIRDIAKDTRDAMKTTQKFVRGPDGVLRAEE